MTQRQPKGIPSGGEFAESSHDEAPSTLSNTPVTLTQFLDETDGSPASAENWLDDIYHRQGAGWRASKNLTTDERALLARDLRSIAGEVDGSEDGDGISESIRRENRVSVRPLSVTPNRDRPGTYDLSFPTSDTSTTVIRVNPHEIEAWSDALRAHAERIRQDNGSTPEVEREARIAVAELHDSVSKRTIDSAEEATKVEDYIDRLSGDLEGRAETQRSSAVVPEGIAPEQAQAIRDDAAAESERLIRALGRIKEKVSRQFADQ